MDIVREQLRLQIRLVYKLRYFAFKNGLISLMVYA